MDRILNKIHELLIDFDETNPGLATNNQTDQMVIRYIKNLINELVKLRKDSIKLDYLKALDNRPDTKDKYLKRWITNILTSLSPQAQTQGGNLNLGASINISNFNTISNNEQIFDNTNVGSRNPNYNFQNPSMTMSQSFVENKNSWTLPKDIMYWENWPVAHPFLLFGYAAYGNQNWLNTWSNLEHFPTTAEVIRNLPIRNPILWINNN